ncbi:isopentenyl-diphosphate Delta-isomerase [Candidatus Woesearchaeota archaeon]|nr:isopentenyl-diphosphate Delta-isomerase [Candidatus Woesearchaeota archaeon]
MERVVLVDENDNEIGTAEKLQAHKDGRLHRAFSIFIFDSRGSLMLQQRAKSKYHSGGLWANTCCSHPRKGEAVEQAAHRRLQEEMGFDTDLKEIASFTYEVKFDNGLWEHEFDHVLLGRYGGSPTVNPDEVDDWKWISLEDLKQDVKDNPGIYAYWLKVALEKVEFSQL